MTTRRRISLSVNGAAMTLDVEPRRLLADLLREDLGLTGTHLSCEIGVCGICTVLIDGAPARACLTLAAQADGTAIQTVEAIAAGGALHPIQEAFWERHALQCGFCTPGFLVSLYGLLSRRPDASDEEVREAVDDVLCRCTGYQNILDAAFAARDRLRNDMAK